MVIENDTLTAIHGISVGHVTDRSAQTGCTVILLPERTVVTGEVRGAAPATREFGLLQPGMTVEHADAIVLTGGSAFGLVAAHGVMLHLEARRRGHATAQGVVPIVPAAAIYDLGVGDAKVRPTPADGARAASLASTAAVEQGLVGAGTGATCAKWRGARQPGGLGSAAVRVGAVTVAALVVVNALGDVFSLEGWPLTGGPVVAGPMAEPAADRENTTLAVVATDAALNRSQLTRLVVRGHDAFGACLRPAHTAFDGDICFAAATGTAAGEGPGAPSAPEAPPPHALAEAAFEAVGRAIENAVVASADSAADLGT